VSTWIRAGHVVTAELRPILERLLGRGTASGSSEAYSWIQVAKAVFADEPEELGRRLSSLALADEEQEIWALMERAFATLPDAGRAVFLRNVLEAIASGGPRGERAAWRGREFVQLPRDGDLLVAVAAEGKELAEAAARVIGWAQDDEAFVSVAGRLLETAPSDPALTLLLRRAARDFGIVRGSFVDRFERRAAAAQRHSAGPDASEASRRLASMIASDLSREAAREIVWEHDMDLEGFELLGRHGSEEERRWAVARVLRECSPEEITRSRPFQATGSPRRWGRSP
jgi:hypothetical protein